MAQNIQDLIVKLKAEGFEHIEKLKGSFRELNKVTNATESQLVRTREELFDLAKQAGDTQRVNKGLEESLKGLLGEARRGSSIWNQLVGDLAKVRQEARLTDGEITTLRDAIVKEAQLHTQSASSIREHVKSLQDLRNQASLNGKVHQQLGADIQKLTARLEEGVTTNRKHYSSLTQILAVKPDKVLKHWEDYNLILREGTASADTLATAQRRLNQLSGAPRILERRKVISSAEITQDPEYLKRFGFEGKSLPELPNTNAAYAQQIKELQQDLAHLDRTSIQYLQTQMQLTGVQRQATEVTRGFAQALVMGLDTRTVERSQRNLQEALTALRAEMQQLDTTTTEGAQAYASNANSARRLEQQLRDLGSAYRHVGDMAVQAATAEQNAANARIRNNYLNRSAIVAQEQALADLGRRVREGVAGTPLMLPAAGQTSAPGTGLPISGGAVVGRRTGAIQQIFAPGSGVGGVRFPGEISEPIGPQMTEAQADKQRRAYISTGDALRQKAEATRAAEQAELQLRAAVSSATAANNGSITSLQNLRAALVALRDTIPGTNKDFKQLTQQLENVDRRSARLAAGPRRLSGMQLAQGVGAAISGGIFGGPEGLIGGLGGLAVGGVGGAFAGAAAGAQVGMFRQQLGDLTEYSSRIDKLQISLRGIVGSQDAYNTVLTSAAKLTRDLNIPQETVIQGMTRLSAAVLGAGGNVSDSTFAFGAITKAIKATGGSAEEADGAILALTQVFSKGKVSAEELNQIAERLPGTFTLFAKATGRTGPELLKALQDGKVGLNDLMKFLASIDTQYGQTALNVAKSTQDAGARLTTALDAMKLSVGRALQPIGAQLQDAFANFITNITPALILGANAISTAIGSMYNTISAGFNILKNMGGLIAGLTKTMIVFAGVSAGVFVASNITTFAGAIRNLVGVFRSLLSIERALLAIETARAGAQALIAGLTAGATKGKIVGAVLGGVAGAGVAFGLSKMIEEIMKSVSGKIDTTIGSVRNTQFTQFTAPTSRADTGSGRDTHAAITAAARQADIIAKSEQARLLARDIFNLERRTMEARTQGNEVLVATRETEKEIMQYGQEIANIKRDKDLPLAAKLDQIRAVEYKAKLAALQLEQKLTKLTEERAKQEESIRDTLRESFTTRLGIFGSYPEQFTFERDTAFMPDAGTKREEAKRVAEDLQKLTDPLAQLTSAAEAMGSAFSNSFMSIINGSTTTQQALATLFTNISNYFLDMAGKIIAKWIEMAILNTVLSLFPTGIGKLGVGSSAMNLPGLEGAGALAGGGGLSSAAVNFSPEFLKGLKLNRLGAAYAANGIVPFAMGGAFQRGITPYAMGGIVSRPTFFAYANGGVPGTGLMGEAGPEAIVPLRRLPSGKLGVGSTGGGAVTVNVSVDATGSQVQGDAGKSNQLGRAVAAAVQAELIKQKRPGGLLVS